MVYPNPTHEKINIKAEFSYDGNLEFIIYDISGRIVNKANYGKLIKGQYNFTLDLSSLNNGLYFLQIEYDGKQIENKKIIKN